MTSAGKWVLGLLLLVVGAVFVARTVASDPTTQAEVKVLPPAAVAGAAKDGNAGKAEAAKKVAAPASDLACKRACVEVNEVANDSVTTAKLAPGSVTLSKLAFEVPNLNELENEINARKQAEAEAKAADAATKAALADAAAANARNDASITAAAANGLAAESAARTAAIEDLGKTVAAADADLLGKLNKEIKDRSDADDVLQGKLNTEIADRAGAITNLRSELGNPNQVAAPIIKINNNEIVADAVTTDKVKDRTIKAVDLAEGSVTTFEILDDTVAAIDLANGAVVGRAEGETLTNVKERSLRGERVSNATTTVGAGDLALGTITGEKTPLAGAAVGNLALGTIGTDNLANGQITLAKLAADTVAVLDGLRTDLDQEVVDRKADVDQEEADRKADVDAEQAAREAADAVLASNLATEAATRAAADSALQTALNTEISNRSAGDSALQTALNNEISNRAAGDSALQTGLNQEISDRTAAIAGEVTARNAAIAAAVDAVKDELSDDTGTINDLSNPVDWSQLKSVPGGFADGADDDGTTKVDALKSQLKTADSGTGAMGPDVAANDGDGLVHFTNIDGVLIDSTMLAGNAVVGGPGGIIKDGTITADDLAGTYGPDPDAAGPLLAPENTTGAVTGEKIADGAIEGRDIAVGTIGVSHLGTGSVGTEELIAGAVTADKQTSTAQLFTSVDLTTLVDLGGTNDHPATTAVLTTVGAAPHNVMVTGQAQLVCTCSDTADSVTVAYQLIRIDDPGSVTPAVKVVSPTYTAVLKNGDNTAPISISFLDRGVPAGDHQYKLRVKDTPATGATATAVSSVDATVINAVDLGRS